MGQMRLGEVCFGKRIRISRLQQDAEISLTWRSRFENSLSSNSPGVLPPETVAAECVAGADSYHTSHPPRPQERNVGVAGTRAHRLKSRWRAHCEARFNERSETRIV